jgi:hypothetical protein
VNSPLAVVADVSMEISTAITRSPAAASYRVPSSALL